MRFEERRSGVQPGQRKYTNLHRRTLSSRCVSTESKSCSDSKMQRNIQSCTIAFEATKTTSVCEGLDGRFTSFYRPPCNPCQVMTARHICAVNMLRHDCKAYLCRTLCYNVNKLDSQEARPWFSLPGLLVTLSQKGVQPSGVSAKDDIGKRLCSFDGDADRLVYHFFDAT